MKLKLVIITAITFFLFKNLSAQTIALWAFDEQQGIYPSCVLTDLSDNDYPLVLGPGGMIVDGKYGNALDMEEQPKVEIPEEDSQKFGLVDLPVQIGRTQKPLTWFNANFAALMTRGENHLRKQVGFPQVSRTKLNLGAFDWTVEFWFMLSRKTDTFGVVFEIGSGPRAENRSVTVLKLLVEKKSFLFENSPSDSEILIPTNLKDNQWQHLAFVYNANEQQLTHFVDGKKQKLPAKMQISSLPEGTEDYMSIGRDALWQNPLQGKMDELRFSEGKIYSENFQVPESYSYLNKKSRKNTLIKGPDLLFTNKPMNDKPLKIEGRKHLFIDDALLEPNENLKFVVNPPRPAEIVLTNIKGSFRKHLGVIEDESGKIRIYTTVDDDYLAVWESEDGINFAAPNLPNGKYKDHTNIVLHSSVGMGMVFIDPNAPKEERWKYISDYHRRAVSLFYSRDGLEFKRYKQPVLPFRSGSQANIYYDDQKQVYTTFHRSDFGRTKTGDTQRDFVMTETKDLLKPWPFEPLSQDETKRRSKDKRTADLIPWYLDNGPLTPGGFAVEYPWIFSPNDNLDPRETDIYVPKALKYPWAPDTYLAFPILYFHYEESVPVTRVELMNPVRKRGSGPLETQLAVSRNGTDWKRYPRPVYVGIGQHKGIDFKTSYIAHGMIKRNEEIWQYNFGEPHYHSPWVKYPEKRAVYRLIQRMDGFVSLDSPYEKEIDFISKPIIFKGGKLVLNIDTDAAGYAQVGFLDEDGKAIEGFAVDDCIYINGDFINVEVEWMKNRSEISRISSLDEEDTSTRSEKVISSSDVSTLQGKTVRLQFRMRGSKLYAMQFINDLF